MVRFLSLFVILFWIVGVKAQQKVEVVDERTQSPIAFAHVMIQWEKGDQNIKHFVTNEKGIIEISIPKKSLIHISYIGYKTWVDSIIPAKNTTIKLSPDIFNLETFVVTAHCQAQKVDQSVYEIKVISSKDIELRGANNLTDLLNQELNMRISNDQSLGSSVSLQGLSGEHVKILIDGVEVIGRKNGQIDLSQINLQDVDHIEVIEGPMSVVYGSNALAGVINLITKKNNAASLSAQASGYYESVGQYNADGSVSLRKGKHFFGANLGRNFFDGYTLNPELRSMNWKPKRQLNAGLDYSFQNNKNLLNLSADLFDEKLQSKGNLQAPYYETAFDQYFYTTRSTIKSDYFYNFDSELNLNIMAAYSNYFWRKNTYFKDLTTLEEVLARSADGQDTVNINSFLSRGMINRESTERKLNFQVGYDINVETALGKRIQGTEQQIGDYAGFINLKYTPIKTLTLQPGLRYAYNTQYQAPLVYSLNLHYNTKTTTLRASYAKGFRAPSIKELYLDFHDVNHNIYGNPNLQAENSNNFNFSANRTFSFKEQQIALGASMFYNHIHNIITLAMLPDGSYTYTNLDNYKTQGINVNLKYNFYPRISLNTSYALLGILNSVSSEQQADFRYSSSVSANFEYQFIKAKTTFALFYKYNGKLPQVMLDANDQLVENIVDDYQILDLSISRKFFKNRVKLTLGAKNLFDNTIIPSTNSGTSGVHSGGSEIPVGWGRTWFAQLNYSFNKYK